MNLTLEEEIRRVLIFTGKPLHPEDIRRLVFDNRPLLGINKKQQSIARFKRAMQAMSDVETVYDNKCKTWKRKLKTKTNEQQLYNYITRVTQWLRSFQLSAILYSCQIAALIKDLFQRLKS